jgi:predicted RNA binding protein YcfA (HicA-like mRNA interferase family)
MLPHNRRAVVRVLLILGFGSAGGPHETFLHPDGRQTRVPRHGEVSPGVCRRIANDLHLLPQRFEALVDR